jgi:sec-independent protein translocase protein TatC
MSHGDQDFSDDRSFEHTRMSFWDHIEELRTHMWRALIGFFVGLLFGFFVGQQMVGVIASPVEKALAHFHKDRREKLEQKLAVDPELQKMNELKEYEFQLPPDQAKNLFAACGVTTTKEPTGPLPLTLKFEPLKLALKTGEATQYITRPPTLSTLSATEAFIVYLKVSMYCGLIISSPWIFYQLWSFIAAGLYPQEKRLVHVYMPVSILLFLAGVALCEFVVLPKTLQYLLSFDEWLDMGPDLRLNEWIGFAILFPLVFGLAFQLPLIMFVLHRVGVVNFEVYRRHRRIAYFLLACSYLIIGVAPDWYSMLAMVIPMFVLYEVGIIFCHFSPKPLLDFGESEEEEMVEA